MHILLIISLLPFLLVVNIVNSSAAVCVNYHFRELGSAHVCFTIRLNKLIHLFCNFYFLTSSCRFGIKTSVWRHESYSPFPILYVVRIFLSS